MFKCEKEALPEMLNRLKELFCVVICELNKLFCGIA